MVSKLRHLRKEIKTWVKEHFYSIKETKIKLLGKIKDLEMLESWKTIEC